MLGDQLLNELRKAVELALRRAALESDRLAVDIAALGKVPHHPGAENPGIRRADADEPDAVDLARLGECAGLQERERGGGEHDASEDRQRMTSALATGQNL